MRKVSECAVFLILCTALLICLSGCGNQSAGYNPITDVNNLEGRRVGVNLAWSADFLLSDREDVKVYRYDSTADMLMALCYQKLDAVSTDFFSSKAICASTEGVNIVEPALYNDEGYAVLFGPDEEELCLQFNQFLAYYRQTADYDEWLTRMQAFDGRDYEGVEIPITGMGQVLNVAAMDDGFPTTFYDSESTEVTGYEIELIKLFANAYDYRLAITATNMEDGILGLRYDRYDLMIGQFSELYYNDVKNSGFFMSDCHMRLPVYLLETPDPENVRILADLDE